jgi:hypothetical protein
MKQQNLHPQKEVLKTIVDAKSAPHAKHTASRKELA